MRKRLLLVLMAACMLTACGDKEAKTENETTVGTQETEKSTEKETKKDTEKETQGSSDKVDLDTIEAGISDEFMYGVDVSTLIVQENSGVVYYNEAGEEQDALKTLADNGVNMVRVRVWNDPYDENGNGYGGGNCDTDNAIAIGTRATSYGMSCMIDYHYSDFWADPSKQMCPKDWKGMTVDEKSEALYNYTKESLGKILEAGVDVSMVQIGNETTSGMAGESNWTNVCKLMNSGAKAIRELSDEYDQDILIVVHFTNPEKNKYSTYAKTLADNGVDYDVFASSYYPFWHGTLANLQKELGKIVENYGKKVMVAEISYSYTWEDGDDHRNTIYDGAWGTFDYEMSTDSQIQVVEDCINTLSNLGDYAVGICYWEPAWIPVPGDSAEERSVLWEKYGSGWATSFAGAYDPNDAGQYYGGSAWDNQGWFDFEGKPLASIATYKLIKEKLGE